MSCEIKLKDFVSNVIIAYVLFVEFAVPNVEPIATSEMTDVNITTKTMNRRIITP